MERLNKLREVPIRYFTLVLGDELDSKELVDVLLDVCEDHEVRERILNDGTRVWKAYKIDAFLDQLQPTLKPWFFNMFSIPVDCVDVAYHLFHSTEEKDLDLMYETVNALPLDATLGVGCR